MRINFHEPEGALTPELVYDLLSLVTDPTDIRKIREWTRLELVMAYDWASREHLRASDHPVRKRPMPWFVRQVTSDAEEVTR